MSQPRVLALESSQSEATQWGGSGREQDDRTGQMTGQKQQSLGRRVVGSGRSSEEQTSGRQPRLHLSICSVPRNDPRNGERTATGGNGRTELKKTRFGGLLPLQDRKTAGLPRHHIEPHPDILWRCSIG